MGGATILSVPCPPLLLRSLVFFECQCVGDDDGNNDDDDEDEDVGRGRAVVISNPDDGGETGAWQGWGDSISSSSTRVGSLRQNEKKFDAKASCHLVWTSEYLKYQRWAFHGCEGGGEWVWRMGENFARTMCRHRPHLMGLPSRM